MLIDQANFPEEGPEVKTKKIQYKQVYPIPSDVVVLPDTETDLEILDQNLWTWLQSIPTWN